LGAQPVHTSTTSSTRRARVRYHAPDLAVREILIDAGGVAGKRVDPSPCVREVELCDLRGVERRPSFASEGFAFVHAPGPLSRASEFEAAGAEYERTLVELVETELDAEEVVVFDHTLRSEAEGARPPSHHVHCDYNERSARQRLLDFLGSARAAEWTRSRFALVNVWRPLEYPVERSPLGLVLPSSMSVEDWVDVDIVFPDRRGQVVGVLPDPAHRWVYLGGMRPDEAVIFTVYANTGVRGVAHSAVELLDAPASARPRKSIESRMFVRVGSSRGGR
jgi:hypothetical protein